MANRRVVIRASRPLSTCRTCKHPDREEIDKELAAGVPYRTLAAKYNLPKTGLQRHRDRHMVAALANAMARTERAAEKRLMHHVEKLLKNTEEAVEDTKQAVKYVRTGQDEYTKLRDVGAMAPILGVAKGVVELYGKATGELQEAQQAPPSEAPKFLTISIFQPQMIVQNEKGPAQLPAAVPSVTLDLVPKRG